MRKLAESVNMYQSMDRDVSELVYPAFEVQKAGKEGNEGTGV